MAERVLLTRMYNNTVPYLFTEQQNSNLDPIKNIFRRQTKTKKAIMALCCSTGW